MKDVNIEGLTQLRFTMSGPALLKSGMRAVSIIRNRTQAGKDFQNKDFKPYSTKSFAMPASVITKRARKILQDSDELTYFKTKAGNLWVVIQGGYLNLKKAVFKQTSYDGTVNLTATGQMLRSLTVIQSGDNQIIIGFSRDEDAKKAFWNMEKGREFLGLSDEDLQDKELRELLANGLTIS